ncbi:MAG: cob(I)yrinic acid a,c-diamide adenosyltransferase [Bacteroidales bacterium]|jgi:cob(I)alamin adenosyltransferase|nr:cob(I)yrinic acid a,c-diamide adenosyltransferase [Bacteroidales bacterium]
MAKIYTKTGDLGVTSLAGGTRVAKNAPQPEAYGAIDELNAAIGLVIVEENIPVLTAIQHQLFEIGGMLATEPELWDQYYKNIDVQKHIDALEYQIDELSATLDPQFHFILPQGSKLIAALHLCRTICRRAERRICTLLPENNCYLILLKYVNRLADFFYILVRFYHKKKEIAETRFVLSR